MGDPRNGGESGKWGESAVPAAVDFAGRAVLAAALDDTGHGGCADDLRDCDSWDAAGVAREIADHVEEMCGDLNVEIPALAGELRRWAAEHEKMMEKQMPLKKKIPVTVSKDGTQMTVTVNPDDILDFADDDTERVILTVGAEPMTRFDKMGPAENGDGG